MHTHAHARKQLLQLRWLGSFLLATLLLFLPPSRRNPLLRSGSRRRGLRRKARSFNEGHDPRQPGLPSRT